MTEERQTRSKKPLIALLVVAIVGIIGGTFAYFTSTDTFANVFQTQTYKTEVVETFESPDDWTPGTTTTKNVVATNKGDVDIAVRVSYTESWVDGEGQTLPLTQNQGTTEEPNEVRAAIINFADDLDTKWTKSTEGGVDYYYYKTKLAKDASTTSFLNSVKFNENIKTDSTTATNCVEDATDHTKTCTTTVGGYAGGTYTLTIKVETVQYDAYQEAWNTSVAIS